MNMVSSEQQSPLELYLEDDEYDRDELMRVLPGEWLAPEQLYISIQGCGTLRRFKEKYVHPLESSEELEEIVDKLYNHYQNHPESMWYNRCPVKSCNRAFGSTTHHSFEYHFYNLHSRFERRYGLLCFINSHTMEFSDPMAKMRSPEESVEAHPSLTKSMYFEFFDYWTDVLVEVGHGSLHEPGDSCSIKLHRELEQEMNEREYQSCLPNYDPLDAHEEEKYGPNWNDAKKQVHERDSHSCRVCERDIVELRGAVETHHIKPARKFLDDDGSRDYDAMNDPSNLVTLCPSCHGKLEGKWEDLDHDEFARRAREYLELNN